MAWMLILAFSFSTFAVEILETTTGKSWTFTFNEDHQWVSQKIQLDKDGWPISAQLVHSKERPRSAKGTALSQPPFQDQVLKGRDGISLWPVTHQWSWDWELKYTDWIKSEINPQWWKNHGIATDCADVVYSARWIFARINGLPMANHLITGHIFYQDSVKPEWEALPTAPDWNQDQRFLAALNYLMNKTYTHTLWQDSYPIAIQIDSLLPGGYHLYLDNRSGHTQLIYKVGTHADEIPVLTLNSTVPQELRDLMEFVFFDNEVDENSRAFLRMRWPVYTSNGITLAQPQAMPKYSKEQFKPDFVQDGRDSFWREVFFRINPSADYDLIAQKTAQLIIDQFQARVPVVENGYRICSANRCQPGTSRYDAWSTPSRDHRIADTIQVFDSLSSLITSWTDIRRILRSPILNVSGLTYVGSDFVWRWRSGQYSSDPNDPPDARWGL